MNVSEFFARVEATRDVLRDSEEASMSNPDAGLAVCTVHVRMTPVGTVVVTLLSAMRAGKYIGCEAVVNTLVAGNRPFEFNRVMWTDFAANDGTVTAQWTGSGTDTAGRYAVVIESAVDLPSGEAFTLTPRETHWHKHDSRGAGNVPLIVLGDPCELRMTLHPPA